MATKTSSWDSLPGLAMTGYGLYNANQQQGQAANQLGQMANLTQNQWSNMDQTRNLIMSQIADRAPHQDKYAPLISGIASGLPQIQSNLNASIGNMANLGDLIRGIGQRYQMEDDMQKQALQSRINNLDLNLQTMASKWGPTTIANHSDISNRANQIYEAERAALMDVIGRTASENTANDIMAGMDISDANTSRQADIIQKFAPLLMQARANSYNTASDHYQNQIAAEFAGRNKALEEQLMLQKPALEYSMSLYKPRDAELASATAAAELEKAIGGMYSDQYKTGVNSIGTLGQVDTNANTQFQNLLQLLSGLDQNRYSYANTALTGAQNAYSQANQGTQSYLNTLLGNKNVWNLASQGIDWLGNQFGGSSGSTGGWGSSLPYDNSYTGWSGGDWL